MTPKSLRDIAVEGVVFEQLPSMEWSWAGPFDDDGTYIVPPADAIMSDVVQRPDGTWKSKTARRLVEMGHKYSGAFPIRKPLPGEEFRTTMPGAPPVLVFKQQETGDESMNRMLGMILTELAKVNKKLDDLWTNVPTPAKVSK